MDDKKLVVVKHNDLIHAAQQLSVIESRVVLACIAKVNSMASLTHLDKFSLYAEELVDITDGSENSYRDLKEAVTRLSKRMVYLQTKSTRTSQMYSQWVHSVAYIEAEGRVELFFAPFICPFLSEISRDFTQYKLENVMQFQSSYSTGFYELLKSSMSSTVVFTIEEIKKHFMIEDLYERQDVLQDKVIKPALAEINEHTDMTVSYEVVKRGRRVAGFKFTYVCRADKNVKAKPKFTKERIDGVLKTDLEQFGKPGESYSQAATRIKMEQMMLEKNGKEKTLDIRW